ncbi:vitamin K epoxide reductase family protein [Cellulomonas sp. HZM]|uniref:vitamin K epoxide reductase family protein n=1 Tax=Cellulomonas sp. HZM TaxID=1454010 RepID=UPI000A5466EB|nr:vitamin K epoxide reductase family protein [Cellulomonas sp. HZM]
MNHARPRQDVAKPDQRGAREAVDGSAGGPDPDGLDVHERSFDDLDDGAAIDPDLLEPPTQEWRRRTAIEMVVSGVIGLYASFVLSIEAVKIAGDKNFSASCDWNSVISCTTVAKNWAASVLGFPNAFLGIAAESVVITVAVAIIGGVRFPRWFMVSAQVVYTIGFLFAYWLFGMAYFKIGALCPWCLLITVTTTFVWVGLTRINIREGNVVLPGRAGPWGRRFVAAGYDWYITAALLVVFFAMIVLKYGQSLIA